MRVEVGIAKVDGRRGPSVGLATGLPSVTDREVRSDSKPRGGSDAG